MKKFTIIAAIASVALLFVGALAVQRWSKDHPVVVDDESRLIEGMTFVIEGRRPDPNGDVLTIKRIDDHGRMEHDPIDVRLSAPLDAPAGACVTRKETRLVAVPCPEP